MPSFRPCCCKNRPNARGISPCIIVWCWDTPRTKVCNGYTATRFLRSRFTAVTAWTSSWFGHRVSTMEPLSFRPVQPGMLGYCFFFLPMLQQTLDPSPTSVPLCRRWKHTMILRMVIICIISIKHIVYNKFIIYIILIILIMFIMQDGWNQLALR
jgi:hypothetical protein